MATKYVTQSNQQTGTIVQTPVLVIPSVSTNYTVDLPPGFYQVAVTVNASVTGTTTKLFQFRPFVSSRQVTTTLGDSSLYESTDTVAGTNLTFNAGIVGKIGQFSNGSGTAAPIGISMPHGFRFRLHVGTAVEGERCEVIVTAAKLA